jgi:hypothetical protein
MIYEIIKAEIKTNIFILLIVRAEIRKLISLSSC